MKCSVKFCENKDNNRSRFTGISFHRFPKNEERRRAWVTALCLQYHDIGNRNVVCSQHFTENDFDRNLNYIKLNYDAIPQVFCENLVSDIHPTNNGEENMDSPTEIKPTPDCLTRSENVLLNRFLEIKTTKTTKPEINSSIPPELSLKKALISTEDVEDLKTLAEYKKYKLSDSRIEIEIIQPHQTTTSQINSSVQPELSPQGVLISTEDAEDHKTLAENKEYTFSDSPTEIKPTPSCLTRSKNVSPHRFLKKKTIQPQQATAPRINSSVQTELSPQRTLISTEDTKTLTTRMDKLEVQLKKQKMVIKNLNQTVRRKSSKIAKLQNIIELKSKQISDERTETLNRMPVRNKLIIEIEKQLRLTNSKISKPYDRELKDFALNLNILSPKAYRFVRESFGYCLPHPRTISSWCQSIDRNIDLTNKAIEAIVGIMNEDVEENIN